MQVHRHSLHECVFGVNLDSRNSIFFILQFSMHLILHVSGLFKSEMMFPNMFEQSSIISNLCVSFFVVKLVKIKIISIDDKIIIVVRISLSIVFLGIKLFIFYFNFL